MTSNPERRFPYRVEPGDDRDLIMKEISVVLARVERMIYGVVIHHTRRRGFTREDVEDMVQETMNHIWMDSLPKYDRLRKPIAKVETFIRTCARNYVITILRNKRRVYPLHAITCIDPADVDTRSDRDCSHDRQVEVLAGRILANPEQFLTETQANVLRHLVANQGARRSQLAKELGYSRTNPLRKIEDRITEKIADLDVEEYGQQPRPTRNQG